MTLDRLAAVSSEMTAEFENGADVEQTAEVSDDDAEEKMTGFREALRANRGISDESLAELGIERDALVSEIS